MNDEVIRLSREGRDFAPGLLAIQEDPPRRLPMAVLYAVIALFIVTLIWMVFGRLDIVATASGQLEPLTYVKIVQPADNGTVEQILVHEDEHVHAGQVLIRMNPKLADADSQILQSELALTSLRLRRVQAELEGRDLTRHSEDPPDMYQQVESQLIAHRQAYKEALALARDALHKARSEYASARQVLLKLEEVTPILQRQADAYAGMGKEGYVPAMTVDDKLRTYLESEQNLQAQRDSLDSLAEAVSAAKRKVEEVTAKYRSALQDEWVTTDGKYRTLQQNWIKQQHKNALLVLRAPQAGIVQDLATHTIGTVVSPGAVLLSLVPDDEPLVAMARIQNADVGFIHTGQSVRVKISAYPFEKYGMLDGVVQNISPDANRASSTTSENGGRSSSDTQPLDQATYKVQVKLNSQSLHGPSGRLPLLPGMQISAEIVEGKRSVLAYLLSPVEKTLAQSGNER